MGKKPLEKKSVSPSVRLQTINTPSPDQRHCRFCWHWAFRTLPFLKQREDLWGNEPFTKRWLLKVWHQWKIKCVVDFLPQSLSRLSNNKVLNKLGEEPDSWKDWTTDINKNISWSSKRVIISHTDKSSNSFAIILYCNFWKSHYTIIQFR